MGMAPPGAPPGTAGSTYYEVKVRIDHNEFAGLGEDLQLFPGMPAEIYIMTGTRTFGQYFLDPLAKSFRRAFREK
jgi:HlyD family secretion protein